MRETLKRVMKIIFLGLALPIFLFYKFETVFLGNATAFQGASQLVSLLPGLIGVYLRRAFYVFSLSSCSQDCYIGFGTILSHPAASIGKGVYIGTNCTVGDVSFGDHVTVGSNVDILNGGKQHFFEDLETPIQDQGGVYSKISIGEDSWLGNSSVVLANIGKKCIIGAGSVVIKEVEDYSVAVGNPAKVLRKRL